MVGKEVRRVALRTFLIIGLLTPLTSPAKAAEDMNARDCTLVGIIDINQGFTTLPPPSGATPVTYTFADVTFVCFGMRVANGTQLATSGIAQASSSGDIGPPCGIPGPTPNPSQICGTYATSAFSITGDSCNGRIGGPGIWNNPPQPGPWSSFTSGYISGWIDCMYSPTGQLAVGAFNLAAEPIAANDENGPIDNTPPNDRACPPPGHGPAGPAPLWYCRIAVSGWVKMASA